MSFEASERVLSDLGRRMIVAADGDRWDAVAALHGELQQRLVDLFQSEALPDDGRPARLLEQIQAVGESVASLAAGQRDRCARMISETRRRREARRSYSQCFLA